MSAPVKGKIDAAVGQFGAVAAIPHGGITKWRRKAAPTSNRLSTIDAKSSPFLQDFDAAFRPRLDRIADFRLAIAD
jgi:hypothetical protein